MSSVLNAVPGGFPMSPYLVPDNPHSLLPAGPGVRHTIDAILGLKDGGGGGRRGGGGGGGGAVGAQQTQGQQTGMEGGLGSGVGGGTGPGCGGGSASESEHENDTAGSNNRQGEYLISL